MKALVSPAVIAWLLVLTMVATAQPIELGLPIDCEIGRDCVIQHYVDHDRHNGTDFRLSDLAAQRRGVNVLAAADSPRKPTAGSSCRSPAKFPTQRNREFPHTYQGKSFKEQGIFHPKCLDFEF